jgi:hypothetical protein
MSPLKDCLRLEMSNIILDKENSKMNGWWGSWRMEAHNATVYISARLKYALHCVVVKKKGVEGAHGVLLTHAPTVA